MFQPSSFSSSSALERIGGDKSDMVVQPSYQCKLCSRVFDKKQKFKNHRFMHLKKKLKKSKQSSKAELIQGSNCLTDNKLAETVKSEVKSNENVGAEVSLNSSNNLSQKADKKIMKNPNEMPSDNFQQINVDKDKLKHETTNLVNSSTQSSSQSPSGVSATSLNNGMNHSYACPFCDKVFTNKKTYLNHKKNHRKKRNAATKLTLTKSNFEAVIVSFIRSIRQETESSNSKQLKWDSPFDLRTVINNVSNSVEFNNREKSAVSSFSAVTSENLTPYKCDIKSLDQLMPFSSEKKFHITKLIDFNKQTDQKRIPLNQNIMPYC